MYTKEDINNLVKKFILLTADEIDIKHIYLFGSYANNSAKESSDIDIAVVSDKFQGKRFFDRKLLAKYIFAVSNDLEVHPFRTIDFSAEDPFVKAIIENGIKLV